MLDPATLTLFLVASLTLSVTPGPAVLYTAARSVSQGRRAGVASALGTGVGSLAHTSAATLGLSALLMSSALAYTAIKYLGAAYLIYLGIRTVVRRQDSELSAPCLRPASLLKLFAQGVLTNVLNPKLALFFLAFLPQFVDASRGDVTLQIAVLGLIFNTIETLWNTVVALLAGSAGAWLRRRPSFSRLQRWFTGGVLTALGVHTALPDRS